MLYQATKHIARRELHIRVRELYKRGTIVPEFVKTANNPADIFTKYVDKKTFLRHRATIMNLTDEVDK